MKIAPSIRSAGVLCLALLRPLAVHGQEADPLLENRLLRSASSAESSGDLAAAEEALRSLMDQRPTSTGGLLALERVLRAQGRVAQVLPFAERYAEMEPNTSGPRLLQLRVLTEVGDEDGLEDAAEDWMDSGASSPEPYREVGAVFARVFGPERALSALERGRTDLGQPSLFALEMGDLLRDLGRMDEAVLAWGAILGPDGSSVSAVMRRVGEIEEGGESLVLPLLEQLRSPPTTAARLRAGARIALEAGAFGEARSMAEMALGDLEDRARRGFLTALARQAQDVSAPGVALWAYESLREGAGGSVEVRALDQRITTVALELGDTARAIEAQRAIADDLAESNRERQQALAEILRLGIATGGTGLRESLTAFGEEFPDAPELDALAVALAARLDADGDHEGAQALLAGVSGPRSALERGYLHLAMGEVEEGRVALQEALAGVSASVATEVIALLDVLDRLEGAALASFVRSAILAHEGRTAASLSDLEATIGLTPRDDRPLLLAMGARIADEGSAPERAAEFRERIVREHPYSAQAPEATLGLARFKAADPAGVADAVRLLEELILSQPNSAIVPTARRELQRIQRGPDS